MRKWLEVMSMPSKYESSQKSDLRFQKTQRVLTESMYSLLKENRFTKLTVESICKEGMISRAAFYSHFSDKYDLLERWLLTFFTHRITKADDYDDLKEFVNQFVSENGKVIKNLLIDADEYTFEVLNNFLCTIFNVDNTKRSNGEIIQKNAVVVNLYINGIVNYLLWQAKNNFPFDVPMINEYSIDVIKKLCDWAKE